MIGKKPLLFFAGFFAAGFLLFALFNPTLFFPPAPQPTDGGSFIHNIALYADGAAPDALFVKLGERVQFNSRDGKQHSIAQGGGDEFDESHSHEEYGVESGIFGPEEAYLASFKRKGTFHFHDHYNPEIFVTVVVYEEDGTSKKN